MNGQTISPDEPVLSFRISRALLPQPPVRERPCHSNVRTDGPETPYMTFAYEIVGARRPRTTGRAVYVEILKHSLTAAIVSLPVVGGLAFLWDFVTLPEWLLARIMPVPPPPPDPLSTWARAEALIPWRTLCFRCRCYDEETEEDFNARLRCGVALL